MATRRQAISSAQFKASKKKKKKRNTIECFQEERESCRHKNSSLRARKQESQSYGRSKEKLNPTAMDGHRKVESEPQSYGHGKERSESQTYRHKKIWQQREEAEVTLEM